MQELAPLVYMTPLKPYTYECYLGYNIDQKGSVKNVFRFCKSSLTPQFFHTVIMYCLSTGPVITNGSLFSTSFILQADCNTEP